MRWLALLVVAVGIHSVAAQPKEIIIIRHAEEPGGNSIHLSARGQKRAEALADFFQTNAVATRYGLPVALFAPRPRPHQSKRSEETLLPTSEALGEAIREPFTQEQYLALAQRILRSPEFKGKTVVIAWPHSYIAPLAAALGVRPRPRTWNSRVYDRAWVITRINGRVILADIPQRLLPADSRR